MAEELQYRGNFVGSLRGTAFWLATALLTVALFFSHTARIGGWSYWDVVILLGVFNALTGVVETVLRPGIGQLAEDVRTGDLDPVSAYPGVLRFLFVYLIPIAWTTTIPASALAGRIGPVTALTALAVGIAALALTRLLWRAALRHYTSAGG